MEIEKGDRVRLGGKYEGVKGTLTWVGDLGLMIKTNSGDEFPIEYEHVEAKLKKKTNGKQNKISKKKKGSSTRRT